MVGRLPRGPGHRLPGEAGHHRAARWCSTRERPSPRPKPSSTSPIRRRSVAPDFAAPATRVRQKPVSWRAARQDIRELAPFELTIGLAAARLPSLAMFPAGSQVPTAAWTGTLRLPSWPRPAQRKQRGQAVRSVDRDEYFVGSAFRFEEVEVIGFRIDLDRHGIGAVEETSRGARPSSPRAGRRHPRGDDRAAELPSRAGADRPLPLSAGDPDRLAGAVALRQDAAEERLAANHRRRLSVAARAADPDAGRTRRRRHRSGARPGHLRACAVRGQPVVEGAGARRPGLRQAACGLLHLGGRYPASTESGWSATEGSRGQARAAHPDRGSPPDPEHRAGPERPQNSRTRLPVPRRRRRRRRRLRRDRPGAGPRHVLLRAHPLAAERLRRPGVPPVLRPAGHSEDARRNTLGAGLADRGAAVPEGSAVGNHLDNRKPRPRRRRPHRAAERNGRTDAVGRTVGAESVEDVLLAAGHSKRRRGSASPPEAGTACDARWTSTSTTASGSRALQRRRDRPGRSPAAASSSVRSADAVSAIHPGRAG